MIIRTANGSLMKVTEIEGQRMIDEHPFDYYYEPDGCEICVQESWTVQEIHLLSEEKTDSIRMCYSCYIKKGGSDKGWNNMHNIHHKKEKPNG